MVRGAFGILVGLLVVGAVAGCGGGDESHLSKAQFTKQAEAICTSAYKERQKQGQFALDHPDKAGINDKSPNASEELVVKVALPPVIKMTEELEELSPPEADEETVEAFVDALNKEIENFEEDPNAALIAGRSAYANASKIANELDLESCAKF